MSTLGSLHARRTRMWSLETNTTQTPILNYVLSLIFSKLGCRALLMISFHIPQINKMIKHIMKKKA